MRLLDTSGSTFYLCIVRNNDAKLLERALEPKYVQANTRLFELFCVNETAANPENKAKIFEDVKSRLKLAKTDGLVPTIFFVGFKEGWWLAKRISEEMDPSYDRKYLTNASELAKNHQRHFHLLNSKTTLARRLEDYLQRQQKLDAWLNQWERIGCRWIAELLLETIQLHGAAEIVRRVTLSEQEVKQYGQPCYLTFYDGNLDSDQHLRWHLANSSNKKVRQVMLNSPNGLTEEDQNLVTKADVLVLADEFNFTGNKFWRQQFPIIQKLATDNNKTSMAKFAFSTELGQLIPQHITSASKVNFFGIHTPSDGNYLFDKSLKNLMAFPADLFEDRRDEAVDVCRKIGEQITGTQNALGYKGFAASVFSAGVIPNNTLPVFRLKGRVEFKGKSFDWVPLISDRKNNKP
jgi:hypothetical protein